MGSVQASVSPIPLIGPLHEPGREIVTVDPSIAIVPEAVAPLYSQLRPPATSTDTVSSRVAVMENEPSAPITKLIFTPAAIHSSFFEVVSTLVSSQTETVYVPAMFSGASVSLQAVTANTSEMSGAGAGVRMGVLLCWVEAGPIPATMRRAPCSVKRPGWQCTRIQASSRPGHDGRPGQARETSKAPKMVPCKMEARGIEPRSEPRSKTKPTCVGCA